MPLGITTNAADRVVTRKLSAGSSEGKTFGVISDWKKSLRAVSSVRDISAGGVSGLGSFGMNTDSYGRGMGDGSSIGKHDGTGSGLPGNGNGVGGGSVDGSNTKTVTVTVNPMVNATSETRSSDEIIDGQAAYRASQFEIEGIPSLRKTNEFKM